MNVLLSGGAGYIGSHAALSLLDKGHSVHIVDNLSTGSKLLIPKNAKFTNCNINDESKISDLIKSDKFDQYLRNAYVRSVIEINCEEENKADMAMIRKVIENIQLSNFDGNNFSYLLIDNFDSLNINVFVF